MIAYVAVGDDRLVLADAGTSAGMEDGEWVDPQPMATTCRGRAP
jgi:hypothetical protein